MITTLESIIDLERAARETAKTADNRGDNSTSTQYLYMAASATIDKAIIVLQQAMHELAELGQAYTKEALMCEESRKSARRATNVY